MGVSCRAQPTLIIQDCQEVMDCHGNSCYGIYCYNSLTGILGDSVIKYVAMRIHSSGGKYRAQRPSAKMRAQLWSMYQSIYSDTGDNAKMATKSKAESTLPAVPASGTFEWVDRDGVKQALNLENVKSLFHTDYYVASQTIYPGATQCCVLKPDKKTGEVPGFDAKGRPNILNQPIAIVEATWMKERDNGYGNWFLLRAFHPELGHISVPATGTVPTETIAGVFAIDLETGKSTGIGDKCWAVFEFIQSGDYDGYFVLAGPEDQF